MDAISELTTADGDSHKKFVEERALLHPRWLDISVAEKLMEWIWVETDERAILVPPDYPNKYSFLKDQVVSTPSKPVEVLSGLWFRGGSSLPHYSMSTEAARRVEQRILELGLQRDYIAALWQEVGGRQHSNFWTADNFETLWNCIHATPEQRCRAALRTVRR